MCNLINTHTHTRARARVRTHKPHSLAAKPCFLALKFFVCFFICFASSNFLRHKPTRPHRGPKPKPKRRRDPFDSISRDGDVMHLEEGGDPSVPEWEVEGQHVRWLPWAGVYNVFDGHFTSRAYPQVF